MTLAYIGAAVAMVVIGKLRTDQWEFWIVAMTFALTIPS